MAGRFHKISADVYNTLWPQGGADTAADVAAQLHDVPKALDTFLDTAARGGSKMTIAVMLSWYKHVTAKRLSFGLREGAVFQELRKEPGVALAASRIMRMVDFGDIVPLEPEVEKEIAVEQSLRPEQAPSEATRTTE